MNKMKVMQRKEAIVIGDSSHNTLSVVRSLGCAKVPFTLFLIDDADTCNVKQSKYVKRNSLIVLHNVAECAAALTKMKQGTIICTFDSAAEWIDKNEDVLSKRFLTPCRGKHIGELFNKDAQCRLAEECGLIVPKSVVINRDVDTIPYPFPVIIKPLYSTRGEKSDIHICHNHSELKKALQANSHCEQFVLQEFIDKEYELDCIGVSTDDGVVIAGAVKKIRHYPHLIGAGAYGLFKPVDELDIDVKGVSEFLNKSNYHGPFSVEFLHKNGRNYFMEVNFRNEGLAQVATDAGANLHALYVAGKKVDMANLREVYMMNYSIDYLHVKEGRIKKMQWWRDFFRTRSFINFSFIDPMPMLCHYKTKFEK